MHYHTIQVKYSGYSVYGGEYDFDDTMTFLDERDLYPNFCKEIKEYYPES